MLVTGGGLRDKTGQAKRTFAVYNLVGWSENAACRKSRLLFLFVF
jgi:hypothetical protein